MDDLVGHSPRLDCDEHAHGEYEVRIDWGILSDIGDRCTMEGRDGIDPKTSSHLVHSDVGVECVYLVGCCFGRLRGIEDS